MSEQQLRQYLVIHGLTQRDAAKRLRITEAYLSRLLNGKTPMTRSFVGNFMQTFGAHDAQEVFGDGTEGEREPHGSE